MTTKIHLLSDLHMELAPFEFPIVDADWLVLAGDIGVGIEPAEQILAASERYEHVFYVTGNHELYGQDEQEHREQMKEVYKDSNVILLANRIDNKKRNVGTDDEQIITVGGGTFWTDFFGEDSKEMEAAKMFISDFDGRIKLGGEDFTVEDSVAAHRETEELFQWFQTAELVEKHFKIIVTHHLPSKKLLDPKFADSSVNGTFASDKDHLLEGINLWLCGHTHHSFDGVINGCRVVINPRGYPHEETGFNSELVIEI